MTLILTFTMAISSLIQCRLLYTTHTRLLLETVQVCFTTYARASKSYRPDLPAAPVGLLPNKTSPRKKISKKITLFDSHYQDSHSLKIRLYTTLATPNLRVGDPLPFLSLGQGEEMDVMSEAYTTGVMQL